MELKTLETNQIEKLYIDPDMLELMRKIMPDAATGKIKSVAEAVYANYKSRMYLMYEDEKLVGLLGLSRATRGESSIQHFSIIEDDRKLEWGKIAIAEIKETRRDLKLISTRAEESNVAFYRALGFKIQKYPENPYGLEGFLCTMKF